MSYPKLDPPLAEPALEQMGTALALLSHWIDDHPVNRDRNPEALTWHRVVKAGEEAGEVIDEMIQWTGGNPRKPANPGGRAAVIKELLDVAVSALGAVEHLTGNSGASASALQVHLSGLLERAGIEQP